MPTLQVPGYRGFRRAVASYTPSSFERFSASDGRFARAGVHSALKHERRLWMALAAAARHSPDPAAIVDLGVYPGTLLRLTTRLCPALTTARFGAGLKMPPHPRFGRRGLPTRLPLPDGTADVIFALEIVEHLIDPSHLLQESRRLLRPGGVLVITTPNVTRIGSVLKLLIGRTNLDRIHPPTRESEDPDWDPHLREYALHELRAAVEAAGLVVRDARHFTNEGTAVTRRSARQRLIDAVKCPFFLVPHFRGSILLVAGRGDA